MISVKDKRLVDTLELNGFTRDSNFDVVISGGCCYNPNRTYGFFPNSETDLLAIASVDRSDVGNILIGMDLIDFKADKQNLVDVLVGLEESLHEGRSYSIPRVLLSAAAAGIVSAVVHPALSIPGFCLGGFLHKENVYGAASRDFRSSVKSEFRGSETGEFAYRMLGLSPSN